jgi:hypothetical protein
MTSEVADQDVLGGVHLSRVTEDEEALGVRNPQRCVHRGYPGSSSLVGHPPHPAPVDDRSGAVGRLDPLGDLVVDAEQERLG